MLGAVFATCRLSVSKAAAQPHSICSLQFFPRSIQHCILLPKLKTFYKRTLILRSQEASDVWVITSLGFYRDNDAKLPARIIIVWIVQLTSPCKNPTVAGVVYSACKHKNGVIIDMLGLFRFCKRRLEKGDRRSKRWFIWNLRDICLSW